MATYTFTGRITEILPVEDISRQSKTFKKKQTIICKDKTSEVAFLLFDDKIAKIDELGIAIDDKVTIEFSLKARRYKGEWYSNAYILTIEKVAKYHRKQEKTYDNTRSWSWNQSKANPFDGLFEEFANAFNGNRNQNKTGYFSECTTKQEAKKKYRELSKKYHPDMPTGDAEKMKQVNIEYERWQ